MQQNYFAQFLAETGLTQTEAAKRLGYTRQYINRLTKVGCSTNQLKAIAQQLGYTVTITVEMKIEKHAPTTHRAPIF